MRLFRARPVTVEAVVWDGTPRGAAEAKAFVEGDGPWRPISLLAEERGDGWIGSLWAGGRWTTVHVGDVIYKDGGKFTVVDEPSFLARFEPVVGA